MPEEIEIETKELQETIEELHEEREEREKEVKQNAWTRYIAMSTATLAVFAAMGAMYSGGKANEAMIDQIRASDKWNEYQSARQKDHLYTIQANLLMDAGAKPPEVTEHAKNNAEHIAEKPKVVEQKPKEGAAEKPARVWKSATAEKRLAQYIKKADDELAKEDKLKKDAEEIKRGSEESLEAHHKFAHSVAFIQVAIALGAISALVRSKAVWIMSMAIGIWGVTLFTVGMMSK
ncbi:MAG: DUF4337 domain-containing protein [Chthonomonadales bacterium]